MKRRTAGWRAWPLMVVLAVAIPEIAVPQSIMPETSRDGAASFEDIDRLMADRNLENSHQAILACEILLSKEPDDPGLLVRIANAYITIITIRTSALIEERDEFKPILNGLGRIAYEYADRAYRLQPESREVVAVALVASGYFTASMAKVKAICTGAAGHTKRLAERLIRLDDRFEGALGYRSLGKFYEMAPWPVGSRRKALACYQKAVAAAPGSLHAHFLLGMLHWRRGERDLARKEFTLTVESPAHPSEAHFIDAHRHEARERLWQIALDDR